MKNVYALLLSLLGFVGIIFNRFAVEETFRIMPIWGLAEAASLAFPDQSDSVGDILCSVWPSNDDGLSAVSCLYDRIERALTDGR